MRSAEEKFAEPNITASYPQGPAGKRVSGARKLALAHYERDGMLLCELCGFGVKAVLEVAHLHHDRTKTDVEHLAILCPNCHRMFDLGLIPEEVIRIMRAHPKRVDWKILMKDAGAKAAAARKQSRVVAKRSAAAKKAAATRRENAMHS